MYFLLLLFMDLWNMKNPENETNCGLLPLFLLQRRVLHARVRHGHTQKLYIFTQTSLSM